MNTSLNILNQFIDDDYTYEDYVDYCTNTRFRVLCTEEQYNDYLEEAYKA